MRSLIRSGVRGCTHGGDRNGRLCNSQSMFAPRSARHFDRFRGAVVGAALPLALACLRESRPPRPPMRGPRRPTRARSRRAPAARHGLSCPSSPAGGDRWPFRPIADDRRSRRRSGCAPYRGSRRAHAGRPRFPFPPEGKVFSLIRKLPRAIPSTGRLAGRGDSALGWGRPVRIRPRSWRRCSNHSDAEVRPRRRRGAGPHARAAAEKPLRDRPQLARCRREGRNRESAEGPWGRPRDQPLSGAHGGDQAGGGIRLMIRLRIFEFDGSA